MKTDPFYMPKYLQGRTVKAKRSIDYLLKKKADYKLEAWYERFGRAEILKFALTALLFIVFNGAMAQKKSLLPLIRPNTRSMPKYTDTVVEEKWVGKIPTIGFWIVDDSGNKIYCNQDTASVITIGFETLHKEMLKKGELYKGRNYRWYGKFWESPRIDYDNPILIWYKDKWYKPLEIFKDKGFRHEAYGFTLLHNNL